MVYYVHGALSLVLFCLWYYYYRNDPRKHPSMSHIELEKIQRGKGEHDMHEAPPVKVFVSCTIRHFDQQKIFRNHVMWVVWLSAFGELMMSQFIVMYGPTYLKEVHGHPFFDFPHGLAWLAARLVVACCCKGRQSLPRNETHAWSHKTVGGRRRALYSVHDVDLC